MSNKAEMIQPTTHEFWEEEGVRRTFLEFLASWSKIQTLQKKEFFNAVQALNPN